VLTQKGQLGLLDPDWSPNAPAMKRSHQVSDASDNVRGSIELDAPESRAVARQLAEESVVLVANNGVLPLRRGTRIALVGPRADDAFAMLGCYTFPSHVGLQYPKWPLGLSIPTLLEATRKELPDAEVTFAAGCDVDGADVGGFAAAVTAASAADVCVVALGDRAGLFGRGTSGEGCDAETLELPGVQGQLLEAIIATGRPVVLVMVAGRPYALGAYADRLAAVVQSFFPGEEGGAALAGVLSGRVAPSGRLPVSIPRSPNGQPGTYLTAPLGLRSGVSTVDPTPQWPFGHGLSYTTFRWDGVQVDGTAVTDADRVDFTTDGAVRVSLTVSNVGRRAGTDVVQLYLHDPVAQVTRPDVRLIGYARVDLEPGASRRVSFDVSADLSSFTGVAGVRIVEPGDLQLRLSTSSSESRHIVNVRLLGPERAVGLSRRMVADVTVE
jgi:beta-xylosidase